MEGVPHRETPLHWAASNDDIAMIDALLDAEADIEAAGSSIDGGSPLSCAVGNGQWAAAQRLVERGARTLFWHEAALGLMPAIIRRVEADPRPEPKQLSGPFWNACHGGQLAVAQYLLAHGADLNWPAPWSGQTPLDIAERAARSGAFLPVNGALFKQPSHGIILCDNHCEIWLASAQLAANQCRLMALKRKCGQQG